MKCLVIGAEGQLGRALCAVGPAEAQVLASPKAACNLTDHGSVKRCLEKTRPDIVFNAAAYTAVDAAESDAETAEMVNAAGVENLARETNRVQARLVHVSTDFVFDGETSRPYRPHDKPNPLNVYGRTKLEGELAALRWDSQALIVRTGWVYGEIGRNFVHTMLRLMRERHEVRVVADQFGTPTYARNLARALWTLALQSRSGLFHYSDSGVASWYDFAVAIQEEALAASLLTRKSAVIPIATIDYPTPARRPRFSVLDKSETWAALGQTGEHWRVGLREMLGRLNTNA